MASDKPAAAIIVGADTATTNLAVAQTYDVYCQGGFLKTRLEIHLQGSPQTAYFIDNKKMNFRDASEIVVSRERKDGPTVATINIPSAKAGFADAAVVTFSDTQESFAVSPSERGLPTPRKVTIAGRDLTWQKKWVGSALDQAAETLVDDAGELWILFTGRPNAGEGNIGRLDVIRPGLDQRALDQLVVNTIAHLYQHAKAHKNDEHLDDLFQLNFCQIM
ncbi:MAG: hypothetical protein M1817_003141 [Caeruleum heppii]|nr:MAG: hypothetical protein M1817_003141 [Caeruleum heppii]